jgi:hypothetical protein
VIRARCKADEALATSELAVSLVAAVARNPCLASAARLTGVAGPGDEPREGRAGHPPETKIGNGGIKLGR